MCNTKLRHCVSSIFVSKKNHEILTNLHYKPLYNISRSETSGKNIQAAVYNCVRTVNNPKSKSTITACNSDKKLISDKKIPLLYLAASFGLKAKVTEWDFELEKIN